MANRVKMAIQEAIIEYARLGWSRRQIARTLGIHRETVARYLGLAVSKPANVPAGVEGSNPANVPPGTGEAKPAIPPAGHSGRVSQCAAFKVAFERALEQGLSAQRIYQDLVTDSAFHGGYDAVKRYVRRLRKESPERFFRLECLPATVSTYAIWPSPC